MGEKKKYILVAEDEDFYAQMYKMQLTEAGFQVATVPNGEELMKAVQEGTPDLILLDLIMPVKDGFETLRELKDSAQYKNIPVIIMSNLGQEKDKREVMEVGAAAYFVKADVSIFQMVDMVKSFLKE